MDDIMGTGPMEVLCLTEVKRGDVWVPLTTPEAINELVRDKAAILPGVLVLKGLCSIVSDFNFAFLVGWHGVKVPNRFIDGTEGVSTKYSKPMISQLVNDGIPLRDLEEYYSLEDAFRMFDIRMAKGVNEALATEAANKRNAR